MQRVLCTSHGPIAQINGASHCVNRSIMKIVGPIAQNTRVGSTAERTSGVDVIPHNWSFAGDGNTLGILARSLEIGMNKERHSLDNLPDHYCVGLFENANVHPVVVPASDFGPDGRAVNRLNRMTIKIPWAGVYENEVNFPTIAQVVFFPRPNWKDLQTLLLQQDMSWKQKANHVKSSFSLVWNMGSEYNCGDLIEQDYYSAVAYTRGDSGALKYRFVESQENSWNVSDNKNAGRKGLRNGFPRHNSRCRFYAGPKMPICSHI